MHRKVMRKSQSGVVLIIGLILLLLLTLIGVAGMKDTQLQEKMAGTALDRDTAMQAAEAALRQAELEFGSAFQSSNAKVGTPLDNKFVANYNGHYKVEITNPNNPTKRVVDPLSNTPLNEADFWKQWDWTAPNKSVAYTGTLTTGASATVATPPRYVIEKLDSSLSDLASYGAGGGGLVENLGLTSTTATTVAANDYMITARGVGRTTDSVVYLQETIRLDINN
jgi:type IV pilus assembly protein PilX